MTSVNLLFDRAADIASVRAAATTGATGWRVRDGVTCADLEKGYDVSSTLAYFVPAGFVTDLSWRGHQAEGTRGARLRQPGLLTQAALQKHCRALQQEVVWLFSVCKTHAALMRLLLRLLTLPFFHWLACSAVPALCATAQQTMCSFGVQRAAGKKGVACACTSLNMYYPSAPKSTPLWGLLRSAAAAHWGYVHHSTGFSKPTHAPECTCAIGADVHSSMTQETHNSALQNPPMQFALALGRSHASKRIPWTLWLAVCGGCSMYLRLHT